MHRILVIGSGGREHALAWRLARDPSVERVLVAPGNDGIAGAATCIPADERDAPAIAAIARRERVTLVVVGPEGPLAAGLANALRAEGIAVFGPDRAAAALETSKWAAKQIMTEAGIPTARGRAAGTVAEAIAALDAFPAPWVVKADGLAAGKVVLVSSVRAEAEAFIRACLEHGRFGVAGGRVVIEEHLAGEEASVMAVTDGERFALLPPARDYKRARDGDHGANTGGMGAYAPSEAVTQALEDEVARAIVAPTLAAMRRRGTPFRGTLYAGLMLTAAGAKVIEFNVRFGDPETEAVMPLVEGAFADLLAGAAAGRLDPGAVARGRGAAVSVAIVAEGYPESPGGGGVIVGLEALAADEDLAVFHAGTARENGRWVVRGGRAAHIVARGATREAARRRAYQAIASLGGSGWRVRGDIAVPAAGPGAGGASRGGAAAATATGGGSWR
ncbi:MAG: phosphoribosylamine--glycine ligase [Candidatus Eisenbacteria bacterium]|nr:phosphoribosylamine--glycine ligase [Candidatus Eisenbacteria bacterium]